MVKVHFLNQHCHDELHILVQRPCLVHVRQREIRLEGFPLRGLREGERGVRDERRHTGGLVLVVAEEEARQVPLRRRRRHVVEHVSDVDCGQQPVDHRQQQHLNGYVARAGDESSANRKDLAGHAPVAEVEHDLEEDLQHGEDVDEPHSLQGAADHQVRHAAHLLLHRPHLVRHLRQALQVEDAIPVRSLHQARLRDEHPDQHQQ
mmetsp:Transcript_60022/g.167557  ORF Transcript_60022/g.167557 Transcript_60022/m.167557 type:complete len:205 (+) Transcript_60022:55-669(+)